MNVIACYKIVPEEQDIMVKSDRTLDTSKAELKLGQYDLPAIEAAVNAVQESGGKVSLLSAGGKEIDNSKLIKGALSRGPDDLYLIIDPAIKEADANQTAAVLAAAARKIGFDLIICGEGSSDIYAMQVGAQLGEQLGVNVFNAVKNIKPQNGAIVIERSLEQEIEVLEAPLPAVISVTTDINLPRIPQLKEILAAGKKPVTKWGLSELGVTVANPVEVVSTLAPECKERKQIILEGDSDDIIDSFLQNIRKEL
ncbi:MAG: electron transfer flavoprotein [Gracilibacteraceae bacterium]|jgi:electron transfer flavoprotein beta subunit|nr:electron transfer flavoprotein [Gracilibacteraceae bacterium]